MDKDQNICFEIVTANMGRVLHGWQQQVASQCFERHTELHERMLSANAF
jgi:hypothetical protein